MSHRHFLGERCPVCEPEPVGIQPRITVDGHCYMLVSEHYAEINEAREALEHVWTFDRKKLGSIGEAMVKNVLNKIVRKR